MRLSEKLQTMATLAKLQEEGKQLQYRLTEESGWVNEAFTASMPAEYFYAALWRVKPEPAVIYCNQYAGIEGPWFQAAYDTPEEAEESAKPSALRTAVKFVEVVDG